MTMTSPRQKRPETTKTRDLLLDCVERLMVKKGYAAVTYRAVAAAAGVTPGLLQYHFPSLDDLFMAVIRRRSEQNVERLTKALLDDPRHLCRSSGTTARTNPCQCSRLSSWRSATAVRPSGRKLPR